MTNKRFCDETGNEIHEGYTLTSDFRSEWMNNKRLDFGDVDALCRWAIRERAKYAGTDAVQAIVDEVKAEHERKRAENLCGGEHEPFQPGRLLTSSPPQHSWRCKRCGAITYRQVGEKPGPCEQPRNPLTSGYMTPVPADVASNNAAADQLTDDELAALPESTGEPAKIYPNDDGSFM